MASAEAQEQKTVDGRGVICGVRAVARFGGMNRVAVELDTVQSNVAAPARPDARGAPWQAVVSPAQPRRGVDCRYAALLALTGVTSLLELVIDLPAATRATAMISSGRDPPTAHATPSQSRIGYESLQA